jgi:guanylate kinase
MKKIITITGPTGSGKSTLEQMLHETYPNCYKKVVSCTTRQPREGEVHGKDYYFMSKKEFDATPMIERVSFGGNHYGAPVFELDTPKDIVIVVETGGAVQIEDYVKNFMPERQLIKIFMDIPVKICHENIRKSSPSEEAEKRIARHDPIKDDWKKSGLIAELTIKKLFPDIHAKVQEWLLFHDINAKKVIFKE